MEEEKVKMRRGLGFTAGGSMQKIVCKLQGKRFRIQKLQKENN